MELIQVKVIFNSQTDANTSICIGIATALKTSDMLRGI